MTIDDFNTARTSARDFSGTRDNFTPDFTQTQVQPQVRLGEFRRNSKTYHNTTSILSNSASTSEMNFGILQTTGKVTDLVGMGGLKIGKFGPGFQRKLLKDVKNQVSDENNEKTLQSTLRGELLNKSRSEMLRTIDSRYNYDLITGEKRRYNVKNEIIEKIEGKKQIGDGLGEESQKRGNAMLRDSATGRFFTPQPSGIKQHYRQKMIINDGLLSPKTSSVMKLPSYAYEEGRRKVGVLSSCGVEEQFSKSEYFKKSKVFIYFYVTVCLSVCLSV